MEKQRKTLQDEQHYDHFQHQNSNNLAETLRIQEFNFNRSQKHHYDVNAFMRKKGFFDHD